MWDPSRKMNGFEVMGRDAYWICEACGQHNRDDHDQCIACGAERDA